MQEEALSNIELLKEIAEFLNNETDQCDMLHGALKKLIKGTTFTTGWIFFIEGDGKHQLASYEELPESLQHNGCELLHEGGCWCVNRFRKGKLTKASNIIECQRIEKAIEEKRGKTNDITYHATIPLQSGDEAYGLLNVAAPNKTHFTKDELALLESVAFQIGSAIKRIALTKKEQEVALLAERNRLARDLHDSVNQLLFSLTLTARGGAEMTDEHEVKETFQTVQTLAQEALSEMRALIWQLRPHGLENGLVEAVKGYSDMLGLRLQPKVEGVISLSSKVEEVLWRVSQEALNNCKKHSGVLEISYLLKDEGNKIALVIEDHGYGFQYDEEQPLASIGIGSMRERVKGMGGVFQLESALGKGTKLTVKIPY
ncbi:GAF domain-containing sensor histidine kinase [Rossellomorea aquimaris]|uniref:GAF domain-containing sensor histidine kinase n=1 Tax=Rossellomorea aquimaris TaxID=189382 RepID=UPI001CD35F61|nr:GAF domain-containing sensor histidine kinase [Rossellomorea aquimaris]MCA1056548.1 GAF domain-containing sensor histidine kinase [Rossellomorea aquimaris]